MSMPWQDPRVQRGMKTLLNLRDERLAAGDKCIGWKIAFGAKAVQQGMGINAPLVGFLFAGRALQSGGSASLAGWAKPVAEPEVAVHLGRDLPGGSGEVAAGAAIAKLGPAIELVDIAIPLVDPEPVLAGNIAHRHVVFGPSGTQPAEALRGVVFRRGAEFARADDVQALPGDLRKLVAYVADYLGAFGEKLKAGDIVICGSIVPPIPIEPDEDSFRYTLDPVGEISVRFTR
jgi:2-keto-4-pentenoate hydratase